MEIKKRDIQTYKKKQVIFKEGDAANCMYDIRWGTVGIYANYGTPEEKLLTKLQAEDFFGEMGLIDAEPRSATAVALEDKTRVEVITREVFGAYLEERPDKVLVVMQHMSHRVRDLTRDYLEVCKTLTEAVDPGQSSKGRSEGLLEKLKKFSNIYRNSAQTDGENKEDI